MAASVRRLDRNFESAVGALVNWLLVGGAVPSASHFDGVVWFL